MAVGTVGPFNQINPDLLYNYESDLSQASTASANSDSDEQAQSDLAGKAVVVRSVKLAEIRHNQEDEKQAEANLNGHRVERVQSDNSNVHKFLRSEHVKKTHSVGQLSKHLDGHSHKQIAVQMSVPLRQSAAGAGACAVPPAPKATWRPSASTYSEQNAVQPHFEAEAGVAALNARPVDATPAAT